MQEVQERERERTLRFFQSDSDSSLRKKRSGVAAHIGRENLRDGQQACVSSAFPVSKL